MSASRVLSRYSRFSSSRCLTAGLSAPSSADATDESSDNPTLWLLIFSDLTTLLLTFFVLRLALLIPMTKMEEPELKGSAEPLVNLSADTPLFKPEFERWLREAGYELHQDTGNELRVLLTQELFQEGSAELSFESAASLSTFVHELRSQINYQGLQLRGLEVRGHSDNNVINSSRFPSNWELSIARAERVTRQLIDSGVSEQMITAAGHGDSRPISRNQMQLNKHLNRRTELLIKLSGNIGKFRVSENPHHSATDEISNR